MIRKSSIAQFAEDRKEFHAVLVRNQFYLPIAKS
jgi:hypothetical protein